MGFRRPFTVKRMTNAGSWVNGRFIPGDVKPAEITVQASKHPTTGKNLEALPEGRRASESYTLITSTELFTEDVNTSREADIVVIGNQDFEVIKVKPYDNGVINHFEVIVVKTGQ
jgi:hypothetical protein